MNVVIDASVAAKWFLPEQYSQDALRLLSPEYELQAPDLIQVEVGSVMLKAVRRKWMDLDEAGRVLEDMAAAPVRLFPANQHIVEALRIAQQQGGSLYDAIHISLAHSLEAPLATNDTRLAATAKAAGVRTWLISDGQPPE